MRHHARRRCELSAGRISGLREESSEMKPAIVSKRIHRGTDLRDLLKKEALLEEAESRALRRGVALRLDRLRKEQHVSKSKLALRMNTSRAVVDRLLDPSNPSITLAALDKAARALKRRLLIELVPG
jgi:antitoxin HicB